MSDPTTEEGVPAADRDRELFYSMPIGVPVPVSFPCPSCRGAADGCDECLGDGLAHCEQAGTGGCPNLATQKVVGGPLVCEDHVDEAEQEAASWRDAMMDEDIADGARMPRDMAIRRFGWRL